MYVFVYLKKIHMNDIYIHVELKALLLFRWNKILYWVWGFVWVSAVKWINEQQPNEKDKIYNLCTKN